MAIGFVLITTVPGEEEIVRNALDSIEHVTDRWMLFGEFDILARVQADDEFTLTRCIVCVTGGWQAACTTQAAHPGSTIGGDADRARGG